MKKLVIAFAAILAAVACNAAAVKWQSGAVYKATDNTTKVGKGATDYLVTIAFFTDAGGTSAVTGLTGDLSIGTAGTGSKYGGTVDGFAASTKYYTQLVITTDGYEAKSDIVAFTTAGTGDTNLNFAEGDGFDVAYTFSTANAGTWQSTSSVPEPTSGLLMLLGVAGIALKRKRA